MDFRPDVKMTQATAFNQLLRIKGEDVTFRGVSGVRALINRMPKSTNPPGNVHISSMIGSVVQFPLTVSEPTRGDFVTDAFSKVHTVKIPSHLGHCWNCECEVGE